MKLKNRVVMDAVPALNNLSNMKLKVKAAYTVAKNMRVLSKALEDIEKVRAKVVDKWVVKDPKGNPVTEKGAEGTFKLKPDNKFNEEINELLEIENNVDIETISIEDLGDLELEPRILLSLDWMIKDK